MSFLSPFKGTYGINKRILRSGGHGKKHRMSSITNINDNIAAGASTVTYNINNSIIGVFKPSLVMFEIRNINNFQGIESSSCDALMNQFCYDITNATTVNAIFSNTLIPVVRNITGTCTAFAGGQITINWNSTNIGNTTIDMVITAFE